jgi:hypothetical protein
LKQTVGRQQLERDCKSPKIRLSQEYGNYLLNEGQTSP